MKLSNVLNSVLAAALVGSAVSFATQSQAGWIGMLPKKQR